EKMTVSALSFRRRHRVSSLALTKLFLAHQPFQSTLRNRDADAVAGLHPGQGPADRRFGCDVQYDRAEGRATHTAIGNAQHILDSSRRELPWNGEIAGFRHGRGLGSNVFQHKDVVR